MLEGSKLEQRSVIHFLSFENRSEADSNLRAIIKRVQQFNYECTVRAQIVPVIS